tara:strand:- start:90 stop:428 length:339 start_codon:yes stop_codon:yes gene_type:complete
MDESRRKFILGMSASYVAFNASLIPIFSSSSKERGEQIIDNDSGINYYDETNYFSNDSLSSAMIGTAMTGIILNNLDYLYAIVIVLITLFLLFTLGIPGYEILLPYSQHYFL